MFELMQIHASIFTTEEKKETLLIREDLLGDYFIQVNTESLNLFLQGRRSLNWVNPVRFTLF